MTPSHFSPDITEFIKLLAIHEVRYVIVGGEAVIYYGHARLTGDVDFFYQATPDNAERMYKALYEFWKGNIPGIDSPQDLLQIGTIIQFGKPPNRIDLINTIDAVSFEEAWASRAMNELQIKGKKYPIYYIGLQKLIKNKKAIKRYKDLEDLQYLNKTNKK